MNEKWGAVLDYFHLINLNYQLTMIADWTLEEVQQ